jgi:hypothetical protein
MGSAACAAEGDCDEKAKQSARRAACGTPDGLVEAKCTYRIAPSFARFGSGRAAHLKLSSISARLQAPVQGFSHAPVDVRGLTRPEER